LAIVELRRRRLVQARIAARLGVSKSTVGRVLARAGLSRLKDLEPAAPALRYEHAHPGDLVHIDTKKLARIERIGHRISGNRRDSVAGAGWEFLFVAFDDRATFPAGAPILTQAAAPRASAGHNSSGPGP
jgi:transcriptional regulator with XRE-family HTH domain